MGGEFDRYCVDVEQAGKEVAQGTRAIGTEAGWGCVPDPDEVSKAVVIDEAVEELAIEGG